MKLSRKYEIEKLAGKEILIPRGQAILDGLDIFSLNPTSSVIVERLKEDVSREEILASLIGEFEPENDSERAQIETDLDMFLEELGKLGLIE